VADYRETLAAQRAAALERYDAGIAEYHRLHDPETADHLTAAAVDACTLCGPDGYRLPNGPVCDHQDRTDVGGAQRAQIREILARKGNRS
jgi:hypothetical protein